MIFYPFITFNCNPTNRDKDLNIGLQFIASGLSKSGPFYLKSAFSCEKCTFHEILIFSLVQDRSCH